MELLSVVTLKIRIWVEIHGKLELHRGKLILSFCRYLITLCAAEFLYDAVAQWNATKKLVIDDISLAFFSDVFPSATIGTYGSQDGTFIEILSAILTYADSFLTIAQTYTPSDGSLAEQFDKVTGVPVSADDLTWSYASFVTMAQRRSGQFPKSWKSSHASPPPKSCAGTSTQGFYTPAVAAGATCTVSVLFDVNATTYYGENIYLVGNVSDLGTWDISNAQPMNAGNYTSERPLWYADVMLPGDISINYQYVRQENCGQPYILETVNRTLTTPPCGYEGIDTDDVWTGAVGNSGGNC